MKRGAALLLLALVGATHAARAQNEEVSAEAPTGTNSVDEALQWLKLPTAEIDFAKLQAQLARLPSEALTPYVGALQYWLVDPRNQALSCSMRERAYASNEPALRRADAAVCSDTAVYFSRYLLFGGAVAAALDALDLAGRRADDYTSRSGEAPKLAAYHASLRINALLQSERAIEALALVSNTRKDLASNSRDLGGALQRSTEASVYVTLGRLDRAHSLLREASATLDELQQEGHSKEGIRRVRFDVFRHELDMLLARERYDRCRRALKAYRAQQVGQELPLTSPEERRLEVYDLTCRYLETQRLPESSDEVLASVLDALDEWQLEPRSRQVLDLFAADLYATCGRVDDAVRVIERLENGDMPSRSGRSGWLLAPIASRIARLRGLSDQRMKRKARLREIFDRMLNEWRGVPIENDGTGFLRIGTRLRVVGELIHEVVHADGPERALEVALEAQCCTTLARRAGVELGSVRGLKAWLRDTQSVAWIVVPAWHDSHVFVVDGSSVKWSRAPCAAELRGASRRFIDALAAVSSLRDPSNDGAAELRLARMAGDALAERIMPPAVVAGISGAEHVYCVGSGLLGGFPASSLPLPGREGERLGEAIAVSVTSSLPFLKQSGGKQSVTAEQSSRNRVMLAATLNPSPEFAARNRLSIGSEQASWTEVVSALPDNTVCLLGEEATIPALRTALQAGRQPYSLAVLVAHGEAAGRDREAALGLAPSRGGVADGGEAGDTAAPEIASARSDGVLMSSELATLPLASAVVLASCRSGLGTNRLGDDAVGGGLAGACLEGGSVCVVASRVPQRLSLFRRIAVHFSEELLAGVPAAEALRRARIAASSSALEANAAAQVELFGGGQFRLPASPRGVEALLLWAGVALFAAFLLGWFTVRRRVPRAPRVN